MSSNDQIINALTFFAPPPQTSSPDYKAKQNKAGEIIQQCRQLLSQTNNRDTQDKLNRIIAITSVMMQRISFSQEIPGSLVDDAFNLQETALRLPSRVVDPSNVASVSSKIALACFYVLTFAASIALGYAFHAWYFSYLTTIAFMDYLASAMAFIGIPAATVGLVANFVSKSQDTQLTDINTLQQNITNFCKNMVDGHGDFGTPNRHSEYSPTSLGM